jgi:hypothetical protein
LQAQCNPSRPLSPECRGEERAARPPSQFTASFSPEPSRRAGFFIDALRLSRLCALGTDGTLALAGMDTPTEASPLDLLPELASHPRYRMLALLGAAAWVRCTRLNIS